MSPHQPSGSPWPRDGQLATALAEVEQQRPLSLYVHVPFCTVRCGYCDFNTYTVGFGPGADLATYASTVAKEIDLAAQVLSEAGFPARPASTLFFGGGTPTLLEADDIAHILTCVRTTIGIASGAEITVEANPETVTPTMLHTLARAGVTRISLGMQSAVPHVLHTLERSHRPEKLPRVVQWVQQEGLDISLDLIYGTPGESLDDWRTSLEAALDMCPDHISAYALVIEEGTKMAAQLARGELTAPDADDEAAKYELADHLLSASGYRWYEISNFAREEAGEEQLVATQLRHASQHNLAYWRDWDWWGFGPGAHSHVGRYRWWNVKHPRAYAARLMNGDSPAYAGETLDEGTREFERIMLAVRTAQGLALPGGMKPTAVAGLLADGLIDEAWAALGRIVLTLRGRLLADYVTGVLTAHLD
ncbi:radical SAM family heme chaperone HemW [Schaalia suimastitidis]|uniref:radical SAM family heme chaperone HemW n=1 Tax=Schaalia suimastitidis TaxID=121163 RepID=UPI00040C9D63|nr:radical SAM family heme chaperone HemW [Schaalia suimastitidis]